MPILWTSIRQLAFGFGFLTLAILRPALAGGLQENLPLLALVVLALLVGLTGVWLGVPKFSQKKKRVLNKSVIIHRGLGTISLGRKRKSPYLRKGLIVILEEGLWLG